VDKMSMCPARPKLDKKFLFIKYSVEQPHEYQKVLLHYNTLFWELELRCPHCNASREYHPNDDDLIRIGFKRIPDKGKGSWLGSFYSKEEIEEYLK